MTVDTDAIEPCDHHLDCLPGESAVPMTPDPLPITPYWLPLTHDHSSPITSPLTHGHILIILLKALITTIATLQYSCDIGLHIEFQDNPMDLLVSVCYGLKLLMLPGDLSL